MKNLDELMIEMDKIAQNQIATELSDDEKKELLSMLNFSDETNVNKVPTPQTPTTNLPPCSAAVKFENCINVPNSISATLHSREIIFQSCLNCVTGQPTTVPIPINAPNCPAVNAILYPIKIVGCIQYIAVANVHFKSACFVKTHKNLKTTNLQCSNNSHCPSDPPTFPTGLSTTGCVCVNTIVGYTATSSCESASIPCESISVCLDPFTMDSSGRILIKGKFLLPAITNCGSIPKCSPTNCSK